MSVYRPPSYADLIASALRRNGERVAFVHEGRTITYREARSATRQIAAALNGLGLKKGDGVAVLATNRPEFFFGLAAAILLGCRYTPLNPFASADDQRFVLENAEIRALLFSPDAHEARAAELATRAPETLEYVLSLGACASGEDVLAMGGRFTEEPSYDELLPHDPCFLSYTGGTTGRPKGVLRPQRVMVANAALALAEWEWPAELTFVPFTPMSHATGSMILPVLLRGGRVAFTDRHFDLESFVEVVREHRATCTFLVPTMIYKLLDAGLAGARTELESLQTIIYGGAPTSPRQLAAAVDALGPRFMQLYGQAEAPNTVAALKKADHVAPDPDRLGSCGTALAGVRVAIKDEDDRSVEAGARGELCVQGPIVMDGYHRLPELTAETLRGGWLHTGDVAQMDEAGYITIIDRNKDLIISGGFNVFPSEIEDVVSQHPAVAACAVIGVPDDLWGEAVKAIVVARTEGEVSATEIQDLVRARKGRIAVPKSVEFWGEIPLTPLGKPDKQSLRARFWSSQERQVG